MCMYICGNPHKYVSVCAECGSLLIEYGQWIQRDSQSLIQFTLTSAWLHLLSYYYFFGYIFQKYIYIYLFLINWWLLYSIGLISAIHQCELAMGVLVSPPSWTFLPPPTFLTPLVVTKPWFEIPESYRKFPLAISFTYDSVYASKLLSPFLSPSLSSPQPRSISRLPISASPLLSCE